MYSKEIKAIRVIYVIIQITHLLLQIIEHSDISGEFRKKYGSVKVFRMKFLCTFNRNNDKHRNYTNEDTDTLR